MQTYYILNDFIWETIKNNQNILNWEYMLFLFYTFHLSGLNICKPKICIPYPGGQKNHTHFVFAQDSCLNGSSPIIKQSIVPRHGTFF